MYLTGFNNYDSRREAIAAFARITTPAVLHDTTISHVSETPIQKGQVEFEMGEFDLCNTAALAHLLRETA